MPTSLLMLEASHPAVRTHGTLLARVLCARGEEVSIRTQAPPTSARRNFCPQHKSAPNPHGAAVSPLGLAGTMIPNAIASTRYPDDPQVVWIVSQETWKHQAELLLRQAVVLPLAVLAQDHLPTLEPVRAPQLYQALLAAGAQDEPVSVAPALWSHLSQALLDARWEEAIAVLRLRRQALEAHWERARAGQRGSQAAQLATALLRHLQGLEYWSDLLNQPVENRILTHSDIGIYRAA